MRKLYLSLFFPCLLFSISGLGTYVFGAESEISAPKEVLLWTNQSLHGPISIYYNGQYVGQITKRYSSAPGCGASGCVTITVTGTGNSWYGVSSDGTKWYSKSTTLVAECTKVRLYSSGPPSQSRRPAGSSSSTRNVSSGSGGSNVVRNTATYAINNTMDGIGNVMSMGIGVYADGVPFLGIDAGLSVFYGEYLRLAFTSGGMTGVMLYGGVGKDFIFDRINKEKMTWHAGFGMRMSIEENHVLMGFVFGENPLCYNYGLLFEFVYRRYFGASKRFGFLLGGGAGFGNIKRARPELVWDVQLGFSVKLWQR